MISCAAHDTDWRRIVHARRTASCLQVSHQYRRRLISRRRALYAAAVAFNLFEIVIHALTCHEADNMAVMTHLVNTKAMNTVDQIGTFNEYEL